MLLVVATLVLLSVDARLAVAQDPPPKIGPFVVDLHGTVPRFPRDPVLAASRNVQPAELPRTGLGLHAGATVYLLTWKAVTFGVGADLTLARAHQPGPRLTATTRGVASTETFNHFAPELSFNFGDGDGWSYLSGGIGRGVWSVVADGASPLDVNSERLKTINYGGGGRWFIKRHLAFSLDVRFYAINPSTAGQGLPAGPRKTLLIMGAGISVK